MFQLFNSSLRIRKAPQPVAAPRGPQRAGGGAEDAEPGTTTTEKPASNGDNALSKLAKLAPAEIMTVYLAGKSVAVFEKHLGYFALAMLLVCFLWRWAVTNEEGKPTQWMAILSATISFGLWVCAMDGQSFAPAWTPEVSSFLAVFWTLLLAPLLNRGD